MLNIAKDAVSLIYSIVSKAGCRNKDMVLVYHSIDDSGNNDPYKISLKPDLFARQLEFLQSITKRDLLLTFDDGFENFFYNAFPLILKYNIKSIVFVTTDFINGKITLDHLAHGVKGRLRPLGWDQLREIATMGVEIGSHTITHPDLTCLDDKTAYRQIFDSKKIIEDNIGQEVKYFAYPYGAKHTFDDRIKQIVKGSGYEKAYTNIMGFNSRFSDMYELRRIRIYNADNMFRFKMKINGAYNWVDQIAGFIKRPKHNA